MRLACVGCSPRAEASHSGRSTGSDLRGEATARRTTPTADRSAPPTGRPERRAALPRAVATRCHGDGGHTSVAPARKDPDVTSDAHAQAARHDPVYDELAARPEFAELRHRYRRFVIPATVAFLAWYVALRPGVDVRPRLHEHQARRQHQRRPRLRACCSSSRRSLLACALRPLLQRQPRPAGHASSPRTTTAPSTGAPTTGEPLTWKATRSSPPSSSSRRRPDGRHHHLGQPHLLGRGRPLRRRPQLLRASRTASRSAATTCRRRRSSASPAPSRCRATTASSTPSASWSPGWSRCCSSPRCCATPVATRWPTSSPTG